MISQSEHTAFLNNLSGCGMPRPMAVALACAVEHALSSPGFTREYGTYLQEKLVELVKEGAAQKV